MKLGIVTNAGSFEGAVAARAARACAVEPVLLAHPSDGIRDLTAMIVVSGLSAEQTLVDSAAKHGMPILGVGAGFGVLCGLGHLDGKLTDNNPIGFVGCEQRVTVVSKDSVWTCGFFEGEHLALALRTGAGRFVADAETIKRLEDDRQVVLRHLDDPTGSTNGIAGITNRRGTIVGMALTPQYNVDGGYVGVDGRRFMSSLKLFLASLS